MVYRSRAVYKLIELDEKRPFMPNRGHELLIWVAAPGGWSEWVSQVCGEQGQVIALDILPMDPIADVTFIQGDFTEESVLQELIKINAIQSIDLVLSDMAPNLSGIDSVDQPKSMYLVELAFELALQLLDRNGRFVVKMFQGEGFDEQVRQFRQAFKKVKFRKPEASRPRSREVYAVCEGLK